MNRPPGLSTPVDFLQRPDSVLVNNVVDAIEREEDEVKHRVIENTQVSGVAAENGGCGILSFDDLNTLRRVIDSRVVFAYFNQESCGPDPEACEQMRLRLMSLSSPALSVIR